MVSGCEIQSQTFHPPRTKRYHHKTNTGCTTCRSRRIKCDERRPECVRCVKGSRSCPGYTSINSTTTFSHVIVNADRCAIETVIQPSNYSSPDEALAFRSFLQRTAPMISISFGATDFWTTIIPQASWQYSEVREMLLAVTSLDEHMMSSASSLVPTGHYKQALKHYNKGIRALCDETPDPNSLLLSSILGWAFELVIGNIETANVHHSSARKMIDELKICKNTAAPDMVAVLEYLDSLQWDEVVYPAYEGWKAAGYPVTDLPAIKTVTDAWRSLVWIFQEISTGPADFECIQTGEINLNKWRISFDMWKFQSPEPLSVKRSIYLLHNLGLAYLRLLKIRSEENASKQQKQWKLILDSIDNILEMGYGQEIEQGVMAVLIEIARQTPPQSKYALRVGRLRQRAFSSSWVGMNGQNRSAEDKLN